MWTASEPLTSHWSEDVKRQMTYINNQHSGMVRLAHYTCPGMIEWMNELDIFSVRDFLKRLMVYLYAVKSHALSPRVSAHCKFALSTYRLSPVEEYEREGCHSQAQKCKQCRCPIIPKSIIHLFSAHVVRELTWTANKGNPPAKRHLMKVLAAIAEADHSRYASTR